MSRYTDIDLLLKKYQTICNGVACMDCPFNDEGCRLEKMLLESPTVDAVPVAHGKWIEKTGTLNDATFWWYECSECGERPLKYYGSDCLSRFCPSCGALMEEMTE